MQTLRASAEERNAFVARLAAPARAHDPLTIEHDRAALHELATNASKYGAVSGDRGGSGAAPFAFAQYGRAGRGPEDCKPRLGERNVMKRGKFLTPHRRRAHTPELLVSWGVFSAWAPK
jgi:hypothetical protein